MKQKLDYISQKLDELKEQNLHRSLRHVKINGPFITIGTKKLVNFCSNDYLGLSSKNIKSKQLQSSSRLVSGNDELFIKLEEKLAEHKSKESALVFPTGYMANLGAIPALADKATIFSDELNHASIIEACKLSNAKVQIYRHNDIDDLTKKISRIKNRKFIVTEGIFSMDGDFARLDEISEIAQKTNSILMIDDAHGDFTVGRDGRGTPNHFGIEDQIDVHISSLSKGLGSFGGYVSSTKPVIDLCINRARSFIYTSALPSFLVELSLSRIKQNRLKQQKKLEQNVSLFSSGLRQIGYDIKSDTHIIPVIIGNEKKTLEFGKFMYDNGVFAQPIRYPTVPKNSARLRVSITAWLTQKHIEHALEVFEKAAKKFDLN